MINSLRLQNFKCFDNQLIHLKPLTLLSGINNTGKSSLLQSLLLLRQSYQQGLLPNQGLALNGDLVQIGIAKDAAFKKNSEENIISFDMNWRNGNIAKWVFQYNLIADILDIAQEITTSEIYQSSLFSDNFHYLNAERLGPRTSLKISDFQFRKHRQIGTKGEYTAHFLSLYQDDHICSPKLRHPQEDSLKIGVQVEAWMGEVSPGTRLEIQSLPTLDLVSLQYSYGSSNPYRATNVGFGISYTLPIIVAVLGSAPGTLILIENPEAHLHPRGQAKMGELLALAASCGMQVIIETHSDHVLNGIRLAVHGGKLAPQDVQLHFFSKQYQQATEVVSPRIDRNGRIDQWPDGFFDQWDKSLEVLLEPAVLGE